MVEELEYPSNPENFVVKKNHKHLVMDFKAIRKRIYTL
jgi:hypothetical protein